MSWLRRTVARLALLAGVALAVPAGSVHPTTISLTTVGTAKVVDAGDGVVWVLALGSEAAAGEDFERLAPGALARARRALCHGETTREEAERWGAAVVPWRLPS